MCDKTIRCDHMVKQDVIKHCKTQSHEDRAKSLKSPSRLTQQLLMKFWRELRQKWEWQSWLLAVMSHLLFTISCHPQLQVFFQIRRLLLSITQLQQKLHGTHWSKRHCFSGQLLSLANFEYQYLQMSTYSKALCTQVVLKAFHQSHHRLPQHLCLLKYTCQETVLLPCHGLHHNSGCHRIRFL